jgi:hypothetical protein
VYFFGFGFALNLWFLYELSFGVYFWVVGWAKLGVYFANEAENMYKERKISAQKDAFEEHPDVFSAGAEYGVDFIALVSCEVVAVEA